MREGPDYAGETHRAGLGPDEDDFERAARALVQVESAGDVHELVNFLGETGYAAAPVGEDRVQVNLDDTNAVEDRRGLREALERWSERRRGARVELLP